MYNVYTWRESFFFLLILDMLVSFIPSRSAIGTHTGDETGKVIIKNWDIAIT